MLVLRKHSLIFDIEISFGKDCRQIEKNHQTVKTVIGSFDR